MILRHLKQINNLMKRYPFIAFVLVSFFIILIVNSNYSKTIEGKKNRRKRLKQIKNKKTNFKKQLKKHLFAIETQINQNSKKINEIKSELNSDDVMDDEEENIE